MAGEYREVDHVLSESRPLSAPVSILILTFNEELNIARCLDSVAGWAHDIVVVDSGSTDRTLAICAEYGVRTVFRPYVDHRTQLQWGMGEVAWRHDWLLVLDADNIVSTELKAQIAATLANDAGCFHGYYSRHVHYFRNRRVRGLKAFYLHLVRRSRVRVDDSELVDFRLIVDGRIGRLSGQMIESNQKEFQIDFWIDKHQRFAHRMALEEVLRAEGALCWSSHLRPSPIGSPDERMIWFKNWWYRMPLYIRPMLFFIYRYVFRLGFLDGWNGFVYHFLQAFWFRLLVDIKIGELRHEIDVGQITLIDLLRQTSTATISRGSAAAPTP